MARGRPLPRLAAALQATPPQERRRSQAPAASGTPWTLRLLGHCEDLPVVLTHTACASDDRTGAAHLLLLRGCCHQWQISFRKSKAGFVELCEGYSRLPELASLRLTGRVSFCGLRGDLCKTPSSQEVARSLRLPHAQGGTAEPGQQGGPGGACWG